MTRWLVTGALGMLGTDLIDVLVQRRPDDAVTAVDLPELDITDSRQVNRAVAPADVVVNCAAWTDVDSAESQEGPAFRVNAVGPATLARACATSNARLLHISTDYVFSGDAAEPYPEEAPMAPQSAYGRTKAAGEWAVLTYAPDSWVLRTAWLYGWHGKNFVSTILRLSDERDSLSVVADQTGQPTWTRDLAHRIVDTIAADAPGGVYHATSSGQATWHDLACAVVERTGGNPARVARTASAACQRPAPRPSWSVLGHGKWRTAGLAPIRNWDEALDAALAERP